MGQRILFFDGVCNLCNAFVDFVIVRDREGMLVFSSLQGETAKSKVPNEVRHELSTVVFVDNGVVLTRSDAVIHALSYLPRPWCWARYLGIIPKAVRDWVYCFVAKNRLKVFGQRDTCRIPSAEERSRFLD